MVKRYDATPNADNFKSGWHEIKNDPMFKYEGNAAVGAENARLKFAPNCAKETTMNNLWDLSIVTGIAIALYAALWGMVSFLLWENAFRHFSFMTLVRSFVVWILCFWVLYYVLRLTLGEI